MPESDRSLHLPSGLADRIDRIRGDESLEHWVRHQLEAAVLDGERALGLVSARQGDQIAAQDARLEGVRDRLESEEHRPGAGSE